MPSGVQQNEDIATWFLLEVFKDNQCILYCRGMAINMLVQKLCREEEVGFVDLWGSFVGRADMYMKDGLHLSGKGAAVFADKLSAAVDSDLGTMTNIFGSKHSLN